MAEEIVIPMRFENQFGQALDDAIEGVTELNETVEDGQDAYKQNLKALQEYLDEVQAAAAEEMAAEKKTIAVKKAKTDAIKRLASQYGGPLGKALSATIDTYNKVRGAISLTIKSFLEKQLVLGKSGEVVTTYGTVLKSVTGLLGNTFPKAAKAFQVGAKIIRVALISTGIGAIVVLIGTLIAAFSTLGDTASGSVDGLSKVQQITIAVKSVFEALKITFQGIIQQFKDLVNGGQGFLQFLKNIVGLGGQIKETVKQVTAANNEIAKLNKANEDLTDGLKNKIAETRDELNKANEAAADGNKTTAERIKASQRAAEIEADLEKDRAQILKNNIAAAELQASKYAENSQERIDADKAAKDAANELRLFQAETGARERADIEKVNELRRQQKAIIDDLRKAYADLIKQVSDQLQSEELSLLGGEDKIKKELDIQIAAIDELERQAIQAAKAANQAFDSGAFVRLRTIATQKADAELLELRTENAKKEIELEKFKQTELAKVISAAGNENLTLEEGRAILALEIETEALNKELQLLEQFYVKRGTLITAQEQLGLEKLKAAINKNAADEVKIRTDANTRVLKEAFKAREINRQIEELELELRTESGDKKLKLEEFIARERLKIQQQSLIDQLNLAKQDPNATPEEIALIEQKLKNLDAAITAADNPFRSLKDKLQLALKLDDQEFAAFELGLATAVDNFGKAIAISAKLAAEANQKIIDDLSSRITETEQLYQRELKLQQEGYANSADLYKKQLETLEAERQKAAEIAQEREKKQAKAQLLVDSALQISNYVTSVSNLLRDGTKSGIVGLAIAIGGIAILAGIIAQAKANAVKFAEPPKFREGGWVDGASHAHGGKKIEVEGGEFVVSKQHAQKNAMLLEAINSNSLDRLDLAGRGMNLEPLLEKMNSDREVIVSLQQGIDYTRMEEMYIKASQQTTEKVIGYLKTRPIRRYGNDGSEVVEWHEHGSTKRQVVKK
jgi:exosortase/archaeosortase